MANSLVMLMCAVLAVTGVVGSSRGLTRDLTATYSCTASCSPLLGSAAQFGVIGSSTVSNDGVTNVVGSVALYPGSSLTGFPPGNVTGNTYVDNSNAVEAQDDALTAYNTLVSMAYNASDDLSGVDLVGMTLTAGKYFYAKAAQLSGNLTFDAQGNHTAVFVIQTGTTFVTSAHSNILLINGARSCNVFYAVGSSATIGSSTAMRGSVIAYASVVVGHGATFHGTVAALNAAVTLDTNNIEAPSMCSSTWHTSG